MPNHPPLIDVHHHALPPIYMKTLGDGVAIPGVDYPRWSPDISLEAMDANSIGSAVLSITAPGLSMLDAGTSRRLARQINEYFSEQVREHPTRFGAFATLPLPDVAAAKDELAYAVDELGLDGVGLLTAYHGRYLCDPEFEPLLAEIADRGLALHVHPGIPPSKDLATFGLPPSLYEYTFETTRTAVGLLYSGVLDRLPHLKLILSHAGGTLPFLAKRITYGPVIGDYLTERAPADPIASLRRLYYDIAMSVNEFALPTLDTLADPSHILYGSDFPFMPVDQTADSVASFAAYGGWGDEQRAAVARENALKLFPTLAERLSVPPA
ncbi:amidohydrolase family protein [Streptomyces sp. NPDC058623]|uniref:amidohydrolase family protein n=1 Tax=Streptomyces sp. NPDC058623 TaxID=3346563 RepID=UPI00365CD553